VFNGMVRKKCNHFNALWSFMKGWSSAKAKFTSDYLTIPSEAEVCNKTGATDLDNAILGFLGITDDKSTNNIDSDATSPITDDLTVATQADNLAMANTAAAIDLTSLVGQQNKQLKTAGANTKVSSNKEKDPITCIADLQIKHNETMSSETSRHHKVLEAMEAVKMQLEKEKTAAKLEVMNTDSKVKLYEFYQNMRRDNQPFSLMAAFAPATIVFFPEDEQENYK
jgi:hypothetical protein